MYLGGPKGGTTPQQNTTEFAQLSELNKRVRQLSEFLYSNTSCINTLYQITDCNGDNVGSPIKVTPTIVANTVRTKNCSSYNTPEHYLLLENDGATFPENTIHSIKIQVLTGSASVLIGSTTYSYPAPYTTTIEATELLDTLIDVTSNVTVPASSVALTIIK